MSSRKGESPLRNFFLILSGRIVIEKEKDNLDDCKARVRALFSECGYSGLDFESVFKTNFICDDALKVMKRWSEEEELKSFSLTP